MLASLSRGLGDIDTHRMFPYTGSCPFPRVIGERVIPFQWVGIVIGAVLVRDFQHIVLELVERSV